MLLTLGAVAVVVWCLKAPIITIAVCAGCVALGVGIGKHIFDSPPANSPAEERKIKKEE